MTGHWAPLKFHSFLPVWYSVVIVYGKQKEKLDRNNTFNGLHYITMNDITTVLWTGKECGTSIQPNLWYYPSISMEGFRKTTNCREPVYGLKFESSGFQNECYSLNHGNAERVWMLGHKIFPSLLQGACHYSFIILCN
jgi:hypothetical protein